MIGARRRRASRVGFLIAALAVAVGSAAACGPGPSPAPSGLPASSVAVTSPVVGLLTDIDAEGLTRVTGFRLRTDDGTEVPFRIGILENGVEFPPGHLAEHMSTTTKIRVFFRDEVGEHVVYRLEDAE